MLIRWLSNFTWLLNTGKNKDDLRVDDHDLTFLAVRSGCTVQEHGIGVGNDEVECANLLRTILEWNVSGMDG